MESAQQPTLAGSTEATRQAIRDYVARLRDLGRPHNRTVELGGVTLPAWLVRDPFQHTVDRRWLLLDDGDAFGQTVFPMYPDTEASSRYRGWLARPVVDLVDLLDRSILDLVRGGDGYLVSPDAPDDMKVTDRRTGRERRSSPDRRERPTSGKAPGAPSAERRAAQRRRGERRGTGRRAGD